MSLDKALDILECISNLDNDHLLGYYCKHYLEIRDAAGVASKAIKELKRINKLLDRWEVME